MIYRRLRTLESTAFALMLCLPSASPLFAACECEVPDIDTELERSDIVFRGVVEHAMEEHETPVATLRVLAVWRGPAAPVVTLVPPKTKDPCSIPFASGEDYIVYASGYPGRRCEDLARGIRAATNACRRTALATPEEARLLGEPIWTAPGAEFLRGDSDGSESLEISDAIRILIHLFQTPNPLLCGDALDADDDGGITVTDAVVLLTYLFRAGAHLPPPGPEAAGFDPTPDDPFPCGDPRELACAFSAESTLPGTRLEIIEGPCSVTLEEAAGGVTFAYRLVVEERLEAVLSREIATCQVSGPAGLFLLPRVAGKSQLFCLCDNGLCFLQERTLVLEPGSYLGAFRWCGRNWTGPSDFEDPVGDPFPPGTYEFQVHGEGTYRDAAGADVPYRIDASYSFDLVP